MMKLSINSSSKCNHEQAQLRCLGIIIFCSTSAIPYEFPHRVMQVSYMVPGFILRLYDPSTMEPVGTFVNPLPQGTAQPSICPSGAGQ